MTRLFLNSSSTPTGFPMLRLFDSRITSGTLFKLLSDSQSFSRPPMNRMANQLTRSWLRMEVAGCSPGRSEGAHLGVVARLSTAPARHRLFPMPLNGRPESLDIPSPSPAPDFRRVVFIGCFVSLHSFQRPLPMSSPSFGHLGTVDI